MRRRVLCCNWDARKESALLNQGHITSLWFTLPPLFRVAVPDFFCQILTRTPQSKPCCHARPCTNFTYRIPVPVQLDAAELDDGLSAFPYPPHPTLVTPHA